MVSPKTSPLRSIAALAVAGVWFAVVAGSGGCELAVGSSIPGFACSGTAGDTCPSGQICDNGTHQCVVSCMVSGCKTGTCDPNSQICVAADDSGAPMDTSAPDTMTMPDTSIADTSPPPDTTMPPPDTGVPDNVGPCRSLGCACAGASACDSGICADSLTVTPALYAAAGSTSFCTKGCCTSSDCDANTVCFATGQGGSYCVNPSWLMRDAGIGGGQGGAACGTGRDCRSALCGAGGKCVDTCCSSMGASSACTGGETCTFGTFPGGSSVDKNYSAFCAPPPGTHGEGSFCSGNSDCQSNLCANSGGGNACVGACRGSTDCSGGEACEYILPPVSGMPSPAPIVSACVLAQGSQPEGSSCSTSNDMCQGFCDPGSMKCTDVCFADTDCSMTGWRCRPETVPVTGGGSYSVLCCGP